MTEKLFSLTRLKCECCTKDAIDVLSQHLAKSRTLLDKGQSKGLLKHLEATVEVLRQQMREHMQFRANYARDVMDLVKQRSINVGPTQKKLQTIPYLVGKERHDKEEEDEEKKREKKRRRKKK